MTRLESTPRTSESSSRAVHAGVALLPPQQSETQRERGGYETAHDERLFPPRARVVTRGACLGACFGASRATPDDRRGGRGGRRAVDDRRSARAEKAGRG